MTIAARESGILQSLVRGFDRATDGMKLNETRRRRRWGRAGMMKRRNPVSWGLTKLANFYFWMAGIPIRFLSGRAWQRWEAGCFRLMNDGYEATAVGEDGVWAEKVPGKDLFGEMTAGRLRRGMVEAAGRELRRCHEKWSEALGGKWSHGDATMSNVVYDGRANRARLIDFEIVHVRKLGELERHADDLLVFLLDLVGYVPERRWLPLAEAFLEAYGDEAVVEVLRERLVAWRGLGWIWWRVRTNWVESGKIERRLEELREALRAGVGVG